MKTRISVYGLLASVVIAVTARLPLRADEPDQSSAGIQTLVQAKSGDDLAKEIIELKQALGRLEQKIDKLADQPSSFSRVDVKVVDEKGHSMSGFKIELTSSDAAQRARASGISNEEGLALSRHLPYGDYRMSASGNGWHSLGGVAVEVGKPLELTVAAPASDQFGEVSLKSALDRDQIEGLPFGSWQVQSQDGWGTLFTPEPDEMRRESNPWATFPTVSDGIDVIAVAVEFNVERKVKQPDGSVKTWQWRRSLSADQPPYLRWLVRSDDTVRPILNVTEKGAQIGRQSTRFKALAPEGDERDVEKSSGKRRLGYAELKLGDVHHGAARIQVPAGQIQLSIEHIYGRPTQEVLQAMDVTAESDANEVWLPSFVQKDSKWLEGFLGDSLALERRPPVVPRLSKRFDLSAGGKQTIPIGTAKSNKPKSS